MQHRRLGRKSSHRKALLRNLVTSLVKHESIQTTWHKAKEAQRVAEKLITLAKRNNETARRKAMGMLFVPAPFFLPLPLPAPTSRQPGLTTGHPPPRRRATPSCPRSSASCASATSRGRAATRVLRTQPKDAYDQAPSAILELVDGPRDMRFLMTAAAVARDRAAVAAAGATTSTGGEEADAGADRAAEAAAARHTDLTLRNREKVTRFRRDGDREFEAVVERIRARFGSLEVGRDVYDPVFARERRGPARKGPEKRRPDEESPTIV